VNLPVFALGLGQFNEKAFRPLDKVLELANRIGIRLIIPLVNNFQWWSGVAEYAAFRGKSNSPDSRFLKIEFLSEAQMSRVEIRYGRILRRR